MNSSEDWLLELDALAHRFESIGVTLDLASLDWLELQGLYRFLQRIAGQST